MNSVYRNNQSLQHQRGFTLIEVLISLMILIMIGLLTSKAMVEAAKLKQRLSLETDFSSEVRTSFTFIERDLNQVFNPRWLLPNDFTPLDPYAPPPPPAQGTKTDNKNATITMDDLNRKLRGMAFQTFEYWGPVLDFSGIRASRFKGSEKEITFITASHQRVYKEKRESIYVKVKYEFIKDTLYKTVNTRVFDLEDSKEGAHIMTYTVLKHVKSLKFGYFKPNEKDALGTWDSESQDHKGPNQLGRFPEVVSMELTLDAPEGREFSSNILFKLEAPNNVLPITY